MRFLTVYASVLLLGSLFPAFSQPGPGGPRQRMTVEERAADLKAQLGLSADQVTKVTAVLQKQRDTTQAIREKYGDDREGMRAEMGKIREQTDKDISALLTDTQRKKYEEIVAQRQQGGRRGQGPGGGERAGAAPKDTTAKAGDSTKAQPAAKGK
jgi:hypothetical protein